MKLSSANPASNGFTAIELLVVIGILSLLSALMLPALAKARQAPQATQCLNNHHQIMLAALMYADDNAGLWFPNQAGGGAQRDWISGYVDFNVSNTDNTNILNFTNPTKCFFAKYIKSPAIFRCPGDLTQITGQGYRVRSVSASQTVGTLWAPICNYPAGAPVTGQWLTGANTDCDNTWRRYGKLSDMVSPTPKNLWVFGDEFASSINDSSFAVSTAARTLGSARWIDLPANYHNGGMGISFADGHAEIHKWVGSLAAFPVLWTGNGYPAYPPIQNPNDLSDINWLQVRTSAIF